MTCNLKGKFGIHILSAASREDEKSGAKGPDFAKSLVLGVDPGKNGALAWVKPSTKELLCFQDMPDSIYELGSLIKAMAPLTAFAVIEDVGAMTYMQKRADGTEEKRGQGAAASFAFGRYAGLLQGALGVLDIPIFFVKPATWKMLYGLSSDKKQSRVLAEKKFPNTSEPGTPSIFARAKDDGRAEAALLALFGAEKFK